MMLPDALFAKPKRRSIKDERPRTVIEGRRNRGKGRDELAAVEPEDIIKAADSCKNDDPKHLATAREIAAALPC
jgi:hypothetical protein